MGRLSHCIGVLLRIARTAYFVMAVVCVVIFGCGLGAAIYFQTRIAAGPQRVTVPPSYAALAPKIDPQDVRAHLRPPNAVRILVAFPLIDGPLNDHTVLGTFAATTANGLADAPDDFEILGGKDANLFDRETPGPAGHSVLIATSILRRQVTTLLAGLKKRETRTYSIIVAARDAYGLYSVPGPVSFSLTFGPPPPPPPAAAAPPVAAPPPMSDLEKLAHEIARIAGEDGTQANLKAYQAAIREPVRCGTSRSNAFFVTDYGQTFHNLQPHLTAANLAAFYHGVCEAWRKSVRQQEQEARAVRISQIAAISRNRAFQIRYGFEAAAAKIERNLTLSVAGGALGAFLIVCLILAFLAIENHSRATREAIARLVGNNSRDYQERSPPAG